ncbi:MAG: diguanylate cyclase domain-containing protein, partial [Campylobacterota bacterium]
VHEFSSAARQVTISVGTALSGGANEGKKELLARADEALYRSKQNGRNRCSC